MNQHPIYQNPDYLRTLLQADLDMQEARPQPTVWGTIKGTAIVLGSVVGSWVIIWCLGYGLVWLEGWL